MGCCDSHTCFTGAYRSSGALWDAVIAIPGREAHIVTMTIHTNITIQEVKVTTSTEVTQNEPHFYGGHKYCDVSWIGSDFISYVCRCERLEMCQWIYLEVNQGQPNSFYEMCGFSVD